MTGGSERRERRIAESITRLISQGWPTGEAICWAIEFYSTEFWAVST